MLLKTSNKNWAIVCFSDYGYLEATLLWAERLTNLTYQNVNIIALDDTTFETLESMKKVNKFSKNDQKWTCQDLTKLVSKVMLQASQAFKLF